MLSVNNSELYCCDRCSLLMTNIVEFHNPALRGLVKGVLQDGNDRSYKIAVFYLDLSQRGVSGISLTIFHTTMYPDVSEGLAFWKGLYDYGSTRVKQMAIAAKHPHLAKPSE